MRRNLFTHPAGDTLANYFSVAIAATVQDFAPSSSYQRKGRNTLHYQAQNTADGGISGFATFQIFDVPVVPHTLYAFSVDLKVVRHPASPGSLNQQLQWFDQTGMQIGTTSSLDYPVGVYVDGQRASVLGMAPPGAAWARGALICKGGLQNEIVEFYAGRWMLEPLFDPARDVFLEPGEHLLHEKFGSRKNGSLPADSRGRTWDNYGTEPGHRMVFRDGQLTIDEPHTTYGAGYASVDMGAKVTRIGGRFTFGPSTAPPWVVPPGDVSPIGLENEGGIVDLGAFDPAASQADISHGGLPDAHIHIGITRTYYSVSLLTGGPAGANQLDYLAINVFPGHYDSTKLFTNDGRTEYMAEALVSGPNLLLHLPAPDVAGNEFVLVSDPRIATLQSPWAMWEVATYSPGDTVCAWTERWADTRPVGLKLPSDYFDGDSDNAEWTGVVGASPSVAHHDRVLGARGRGPERDELVKMMAGSLR